MHLRTIFTLLSQNRIYYLEFNRYLVHSFSRQTLMYEHLLKKHSLFVFHSVYVTQVHECTAHTNTDRDTDTDTDTTCPSVNSVFGFF